MGKFEKEKRGVKKSNTNAAKGRQQEPINSESYAAVARRGLVPTEPPASSTHAAQETMEDYEGNKQAHGPTGNTFYCILESIIFFAHLFHAHRKTFLKSLAAATSQSSHSWTTLPSTVPLSNSRGPGPPCPLWHSS